jgi:hypothetical protein
LQEKTLIMPGEVNENSQKGSSSAISKVNSDNPTSEAPKQANGESKSTPPDAARASQNNPPSANAGGEGPEQDDDDDISLKVIEEDYLSQLKFPELPEEDWDTDLELDGNVILSF